MTELKFKENLKVDKYGKVYCINNKHLTDLYAKHKSSLLSLALLMGNLSGCENKPEKI